MTVAVSDVPPTTRGREPERRIAVDHLRRAQQGAGGVMLVVGEPGTGKSALLREAGGGEPGRGVPG